MKKIFFILLLLPIITLAQLQIPYAVKNVNNKPIDFWYYNPATLFPWANTTDILTNAVRIEGQLYYVSGGNVYTFKGGILNDNLVLFGAGGGGTWGSITGTLSNQTDLNTALNGKQGILDGSTAYDVIVNSLNGILFSNSVNYGSNSIYIPSGAAIALGTNAKLTLPNPYFLSILLNGNTTLSFPSGTGSVPFLASTNIWTGTNNFTGSNTFSNKNIFTSNNNFTGSNLFNCTPSTILNSKNLFTSDILNGIITITSNNPLTLTFPTATDLVTDSKPYSSTYPAGFFDFMIDNSSSAAAINLALGTGMTWNGSSFSAIPAGYIANFRINITSPTTCKISLIGNSLGTTPSIAAGASAGTSPTVSVIGNNMDGIITVTTGTAPTANGILATVTMSGSFAYPTSTTCILQPANAATAAVTGSNEVYVTGTTTTFVINANTTALSASTSYVWRYHNGGY
jgi:hypothetical protein